MLEKSARGPHRGTVAELIVALKLTSEGFHVSFSPCTSPHDLIAEKDGVAHRLQVKLSYQRGKTMVVNMSSNTATGRKHYRQDQFDYFAIVVSQDDDVDVYFWPNMAEERAQRVVSDEIKSNTTLG